MTSNVDEASTTDANSDTVTAPDAEISKIQGTGNDSENIPDGYSDAADASNDNDDTKEVSTQVHQIKFQTQRRYVYFTTEDEKAAEILKRYSELLMKKDSRLTYPQAN